MGAEAEGGQAEPGVGGRLGDNFQVESVFHDREFTREFAAEVGGGELIPEKVGGIVPGDQLVEALGARAGEIEGPR